MTIIYIKVSLKIPLKNLHQNKDMLIQNNYLDTKKGVDCIMSIFEYVFQYTQQKPNIPGVIYKSTCHIQ